MAGAPLDAAARAFLLELGQHAGAHEGTLAAARVAVDHHQMLADQSLDDLVGQLFPTKEDWPLFGLERAEARIRSWRQFDLKDGVERLSGWQRHRMRSTAALASTSQLPTSGAQVLWVVSIQSMASARAMALRRGVAIAGPAVSSTAHGSSLGTRSRQMPILSSDHDQIGIEGETVVGAKEKQSIAAAQGVHPALRDRAARLRDHARPGPARPALTIKPFWPRASPAAANPRYAAGARAGR